MTQGYFVELTDFPSAFGCKIIKVDRDITTNPQELINCKYPIVLFGQLLCKVDQGDPRFDKTVRKMKSETAKRISILFFETIDQFYELFERQFIAATGDAKMTDMMVETIRAMAASAESQLPNQN
jgi:hypothetical protein